MSKKVIEGNVDLIELYLEELPDFFKDVSVEGEFYCNKNQLTSLEGSPQSVGGSFYCNNNQLTSLEGSPQSVGGNFYCSNNQLTSLEGSPQNVGGNFYCSENTVKFTEAQVRAVCEVKGRVYV
jgi:hypothetical protein